MQEGRTLNDREINRGLLNTLFENRLWYWGTIVVLALIVLGAMCAAGYMFNKGLGVTGLNRPVMWGFFITNFVFWIGISHAGVMLSAILRLSKAEWRRPATRAAEVLTVFSLMTAMLMPLLHTGRPWRIFYWVFPYDWARGIYPDIRSALIWDPSAVFTYLSSSILFVYVALIPDLAVIRDRSSGIRRLIYGILCLGWRGTSRQWKLQIIAGILLSALILPVFVSVHSIVSFDFSMAIAVKSWHSTIFPPYFVIGAVHSGVAAVVIVMALMRWFFGWYEYIRPEHFDALGRLLIVVATGWFFFFVMEFLFGLYSLEGDEIAVKDFVTAQAPWSWWFITFVGTTYFIPVGMWLFKRIRRNPMLMVIACVSVNIGMWLERFLIIVPGLAQKQTLSQVWYTYAPSVVEIVIVIGTFALVSMLLLLFAKVLPLIPLYDIKEGEILRSKIQIGRRTVPAVIRED
jgi:molybdopterin-containing oxidoreductase family membrane subunit